MNVSDIRFDYAGGNDTINITFRNILSTIIISKYLDFYYSSFNKILPYTWTESIFFLPRTNSSTDVSAYGQTTTKPLFNITTENYGKDMNLSIRLSESNTCLNIILSDNSTKSTGDNLSTSWTEISNNSGYLTNNNFWAWADLDNCNASEQRILNPKFEFNSYCDDCFWSEI